MTRGGGEIRRPEGVFNSAFGSGSGSGVVTGGWVAGGVVKSRVGAVWEGGLGGKRGVVLAVGGAPVRGGAEGFGGGAVTLELEVSFETLGMGLVTAVDQAGGTFVTGAGSN